MSPSVIMVPSSSGSSGEDDRKRKRRLSNRESARRSRQRKQKHETDLIDEMGYLKRTVTEVKQELVNLVNAHSVLEDENKILSNEKVRLQEELEYLNQIINKFGGQQLWSSSESDLIGFSEPSMSLNPWQFQESANYIHFPVAASGSMFNF